MAAQSAAVWTERRRALSSRAAARSSSISSPLLPLSLSFFLIPSRNLDRVLSLSFSWGGHITLLSQNSLHQQLCSTFSLSCPYIGERIGRDCPRGDPVTLGGVLGPNSQTPLDKPNKAQKGGLGGVQNNGNPSTHSNIHKQPKKQENSPGGSVRRCT